MHIQSELCHIETTKIIVKISFWDNQTCLGSSLGQGQSVYEAEDAAILRLKNRLSLDTKNIEQRAETTDARLEQSGQGKQIKKQTDNLSNFTEKVLIEAKPEGINHQRLLDESPEPKDWSEELAEIDLAVRKLGWTREQENQFLLSTFSIQNRQRITSYNILINYISKLKERTQKSNTNDNMTDDQRNHLMQISDRLIAQLGWGTNQAKNFLHTKMNIKSRQSLSIQDLTRFNDLLSIELKSTSTAG